MAKNDFEKLYKQQKIFGWMSVVMAAGTIFKFVQAKFHGIVPYDAVVTGSLAAMCLLGYFLYSVKIDRAQEAEIQQQIKRRRSKNRKQQTTGWSDTADDSDEWEDDEADSRRRKNPVEAKRPILSGFPKWLAIGAVGLGTLWGVMWIAVNAHNWFDSPPPSIAQWDDIALENSAIRLKMPPSTGGKIESELGPEVARVAIESAVRQHGSRAFFALRAEPVVQYRGWPTQKQVDSARQLWLTKMAREASNAGGRADDVIEITQLSTTSPLYGFRTHFKARSLANYSIEGLSILLPDGKALDLQYWTKGEDPTAEADAFFATLSPLENFGKRKPVIASKPRDLDAVEWRERAAKQNQSSASPPQSQASAEKKPFVSPPPPRELTRKLLDPLPEPAEVEAFRAGDRYGTAITSRGYKEGRSKPLLMVIPDGLRGDLRYHTLLADFEATGFAVFVMDLTMYQGEPQSFSGFLNEARQLNHVIDDVLDGFRFGYTKEKFVIGFGSGGHLAGMGAVGINFGEAFASVDGGYVDFTGDAEAVATFDLNPQTISDRTFVPHIDKLRKEFRLFVLDDDPQSSVQRTAAAIRASGKEFYDGRPPSYGRWRVSLIDVPSKRPADEIPRVHQCLQELLVTYAAKAGLEVKRDTSPATPAIAPEDSPAGTDFIVKQGTGIPPYHGPDKNKEDDKPPVELPEGPPYDELLVSPDRQLLRSGPPPADKLPQEELLSEFEKDFRELRSRVKTETYDADRKLTGRFVRGDGVRRGEKAPALLLLHSGLTSDPRDLALARPFIESGFHVFCPTYRGETDPDQYPFTAFLDEAEDAATAARWLATQEEVDAQHVYALGIGAGGHVAGLLSLRDVPLRSTASIDGVIDPETDGRGIFDVYEPGPSAHRLRSLVGNLGDMKREHVVYFTYAAMERAYAENKNAGLALARQRVTKEASNRAKVAAWQAGESETRRRPNRLEARSAPIGGTALEKFGSLLVDGQDRSIDRNAPPAEQTSFHIRLYLKRCQADVPVGGQ